MKRADDVFFFTLIDFLVQVFFFGLMLYVLAQAAQREIDQERTNEEKQVKKLKEATGISNITELTDELTKLAPIKELRGIADFIGRTGGPEHAKKLAALAAESGGITQLSEKLDKLKKFEEGSGKRPCLAEEAEGGKRIVKPLAVVFAADNSLRFKESNPELEKVLALLGKRFEAVKELSHVEFAKTFAPLVKLREDCRYTLTFVESTRFVDARDAVRFSFVLNIVKAKTPQ